MVWGIEFWGIDRFGELNFGELTVWGIDCLGN
jgi:hypothetical protein